MPDHIFIMLQGLLAFGAPLTLAFIELYKLRRRTPAPVGGGEPNIVMLTPRRGRSMAMLPEPANADGELKRAA